MAESEDTLQVNSAERLLTFIYAFKELTTTKATTRDVLADMYGIGVRNNPELIKAVTDIWQLPSQLRSQLGEIDGLDTQLFNRPINEIETALTYLALDRPPEDFTRRVSDNLAHSIGMISAVIKKDVPQLGIAADARAKLIEDVETLIEAAREGEYDHEFTIFITSRLESLLYALKKYDTLGSVKIIEEVDQLFGGLFRQMPSISQSESKKSFAKKLKILGGSILIAMQLTNQASQLQASVSKLLGDHESKTVVQSTSTDKK